MLLESAWHHCSASAAESAICTGRYLLTFWTLGQGLQLWREMGKASGRVFAALADSLCCAPAGAGRGRCGAPAGRGTDRAAVAARPARLGQHHARVHARAGLRPPGSPLPGAPARTSTCEQPAAPCRAHRAAGSRGRQGADSEQRLRDAAGHEELARLLVKGASARGTGLSAADAGGRALACVLLAPAASGGQPGGFAVHPAALDAATHTAAALNASRGAHSRFAGPSMMHASFCADDSS
jgi:hypothetical protein